MIQYYLFLYILIIFSYRVIVNNLLDLPTFLNSERRVLQR